MLYTLFLVFAACMVGYLTFDDELEFYPKVRRAVFLCALPGFFAVFLFIRLASYFMYLDDVDVSFAGFVADVQAEWHDL